MIKALGMFNGKAKTDASLEVVPYFPFSCFPENRESEGERENTREHEYGKEK